MEVGAKKIAALKDLQKADAKGFEKLWKSIRKDGAYVEAGENDNVIVQKLEANKNAFGIFGYSFLEENTAKLKGVAIDGVEPTYDTISSGKYKGARPLFVYVKKQHVGVVPGIDKFVAEYVSAKAMSKDGYLARKGLVALPKAEADKIAADCQGHAGSRCGRREVREQRYGRPPQVASASLAAAGTLSVRVMPAR